jgi:hypothetical protein
VSRPRRFACNASRGYIIGKGLSATWRFDLGVTVSRVTPIEELQLFCYQAEQVRQLKLVRKRWSTSLTLRASRAGGATFSLTEPDEEELRSLLLALRRFVADSEPTFLNHVYNLCEQHITSDLLREDLRGARQAWKQAQKSLGIAWTHNGREVAPAHVADLWINGHYFHSDPDKLRELRALVPAGLTRYTFLTFIGETVLQVYYLENVIRHALRDGCVRP